MKNTRPGDLRNLWVGIYKLQQWTIYVAVYE